MDSDRTDGKETQRWDKNQEQNQSESKGEGDSERWSRRGEKSEERGKAGLTGTQTQKREHGGGW